MGLDFRPLALPVLEDCVRRLLSRRLEAALFFFSENLRLHDWRPDSAGGGADAAGEGSSGGPPAGLMRHPPLAQLCNDLLDSLNQLRYCVLLSLTEDVRSQVRDALTRAGTLLGGWGRLLASTGRQVGPVLFVFWFFDAL